METNTGHGLVVTCVFPRARVSSPDRSDDRLDGRQQVLHGDVTVTALLIEPVLSARHVGVCCCRPERGRRDRDEGHHVSSSVGYNASGPLFFGNGDENMEKISRTIER